MNILIVHVPFCTPAAPAYGATYLHGVLTRNLPHDSVGVFDANLEFHTRRFANAGEFFRSGVFTEYGESAKQFLQETKEVYARSNRAVREGNPPELFDELLELVLKRVPDVVVMSVVFSSQAFYALAFVRALKQAGVRVIVGGPAVNHSLVREAQFLPDEYALVHSLRAQGDSTSTGSGPVSRESVDVRRQVDFSVWPLRDYFSAIPVLPLKSSNTCYYQKCAFCTHHTGAKYAEYDLEDIHESVVKSNEKCFFFIDDMIHKQRLLKIAELLKPLGVLWMCQLRPTRDLDRKTLQALYDAGLRHVIWGVESGSDRILSLMRKGTNSADAQGVLRDAHEVGICNGVYILFGFPTETREEFMLTIDFLKRNRDCIDIVMTSVFGLQRGAPAFKDPSSFGLKTIVEKPRELLGPQVSYTVESGLQRDEVVALKKKFAGTFRLINKLPKEMNFFREHVLCALR